MTAGRRLAVLEAAMRNMFSLLGAYLTPSTTQLNEQEFISKVIEEIDNPEMFEVMSEVDPRPLHEQVIGFRLF